MLDLQGNKMNGTFVTRTFKVTFCTVKVYKCADDSITEMVISVDGCSPDLRKELDKRFDSMYGEDFKLLKVISSEVISNRYAISVEDFIKYGTAVQALDKDENEQG